ncbi:LPS translocon maturation chaperone LptM [Alteromonas lipolytica]|uniref:LPS translocon maturation chaperone LptM n=1 Tax=Alteromonas lipolytica TaxID=1856405 RepID=UPI0015865FC7|nr:lipoprotein [Alteromonas lipolytica]
MAKRVALLLVLLLSISACGYRGALYLPEQPPASDNEPANDSTPDASGESR